MTGEIDVEIAGLSPRGRQVIAARSGHWVHHNEPELVVAAIRAVVDAARSTREASEVAAGRRDG